MNNLFSQRALKKRYQVGDQNGPITLLSPPLKITLGIGILIALAGGIWSIFARIPLSVQGVGVLLPVSTINPSLSATDGVAYWMFDQPKQKWHQEVSKFLNQPDTFNDEDMAALAREVLAASSATKQRDFKVKITSAEKFAQNLNRSFYGQAIEKGRLLMWVHSNENKERVSTANDQLTRTLRDTNAKEKNIEAHQDILRSELKSRWSYLEQMRQLESQGFVTRASILQEESTVDGIKAKIYANQNELISIGNQRDEAYKKLRNELASLLASEMIFSPSNVYLSQIVPNNGQSVTKGQPVLQLSDDKLDDPVMVPLFLSSKDMAQVFPGMKALATPSGYKRSEVGGIRGNIISMAKVPSGIEEITARVGLRSLASVISKNEPSPTLAVLALQRSASNPKLNSGGYQWSSNGDLPFPPTPGDRLNVEITTRNVAPIELVIPAMKRFFGITPIMPPEYSNQS